VTSDLGKLRWESLVVIFGLSRYFFWEIFIGSHSLLVPPLWSPNRSFTLFLSAASSPLLVATIAPESALPPDGVGQAALRFYKLEFPTYDGLEDLLNWLNHCE
jgi:hypothetical protein